MTDAEYAEIDYLVAEIAETHPNTPWFKPSRNLDLAVGLLEEQDVTWVLSRDEGIYHVSFLTSNFVPVKHKELPVAICLALLNLKGIIYGN